MALYPVNYNESTPYDIDSLQYPQDLSSNPAQYGYNRVLFFINVVANSKFRSVDNIAVGDIPESDYRQAAGRRAAERLEGFVSSPFLAKNEQGKIDTKDLTITAPYKRLLSAISLYVPNELSHSYSANWGEEDLFFSENIAQTGLDVVDSIKDGSIGGLAGAVFRGGARAATAAALRVSSAGQSATRLTPGNARAEQLFQSVDFKTFSFNYEFAPRDKSEADNVLRIVRMFKHHMLPEYKDDNDFLYVYPSEFEVKYYYADQENQFLEKHFTAVLTQCNITYTPNGQFTTFTGGMPTQIRLTLTFKELGKPTKETSPFDKAGV
jgi:hypothetical protein